LKKIFNLNGTEYLAESLVDNVLVNPTLPDDFYVCSYHERDAQQIKMFWAFAYIETDSYLASNERYTDYKTRLTLFSNTTILETEDQFNKRMHRIQAEWLRQFPTGIMYTVHCLDDETLDKPTIRGRFGSLEEAVSCCLNGHKREVYSEPTTENL